MKPYLKPAVPWAVAGALFAGWAAPTMAAGPVKGGVLKFVVPDEPPSFDGHKETTLALINPI
jgi:peptide/nickel transport system substrate-binding protein